MSGGLNSPTRRAAITGVVQQKNVSVVCLQESKMNMLDAPIINDFVVLVLITSLSPHLLVLVEE